MFPLQSFLLLLEQHGFAKIGIAERRRLQQLLETEGEYYAQHPDELKYLIAPIFAKSPAEQEKLYAVFDNFCASHLQEAQKLVAEGKPLLEISTREVIYETLHRYRYIVYALLLLLGVNLGVFVWQKVAIPKETIPTTITPACPHQYAPQNVAFSLQPNTDTIALGSPLTIIDQTPANEKDSLHLTWQVGDTTYTQILPILTSKQGGNATRKITFKGLTKEEGSLSISLQARYATDTTRLCPDTNLVRTLWVKDPNKPDVKRRIALPTAHALTDRDTQTLQIPWVKYLPYCLLLFALGFVGELFARWLRALHQYQPPIPEHNLDEEEEEPQSYSQPFHLSYPRQAWTPEPFMYDVANALRQRETSERKKLDMRASVRATAQQAGMPTLVEKHLSRPTQYLALIDSACRDDHQAAFFEQWVDSLTEQDVLIERLTFRHDIRMCVNSEHPNGISLQDLYAIYPLHRLLVLSDGDYFISTLRPQLNNWVTPLLGSGELRRLWKQRALITPRPIAEWDYRERLLAQVFSIVPANPEGQLMLVELLTNDDPYDYRRHKKQFSQLLADQNIEQLPNDWYEEFAQNPNFDTQDSTPTYLKIWLAAVALHPEPTYEVLMAMGKALQANPPKELQAYSQQQAPDFSRMLPFARIEWLRSGKIPTKTRRKLQDFIKQYPNTEAIARKTVLELLQGMNPPPNSLAYYEHKDLVKEHQKALRLLRQNKTAQLEPPLLAYINQELSDPEPPPPPPPLTWQQKLKQWHILQAVWQTATQYLRQTQAWLLRLSLALLLLVAALYAAKQMGYIQPAQLPQYVQLNNQAAQLITEQTKPDYLNAAEQQLLQAQQLQPSYNYAQHNLRVVQYLRGMDIYNDSTKVRTKELQNAIDWFDKSTQSDQIVRESDPTLYVTALHAAGVTHYYAQQPDTAQTYYNRIMAQDSLYFGRIAAPNLATLLQQSIIFANIESDSKNKIEGAILMIGDDTISISDVNGIALVNATSIQKYFNRNLSVKIHKENYHNLSINIYVDKNTLPINAILIPEKQTLTANDLSKYNQLKKQQKQQYERLLNEIIPINFDSNLTGFQGFGPQAKVLLNALNRTERELIEMEYIFGKDVLGVNEPTLVSAQFQTIDNALKRKYNNVRKWSNGLLAIKDNKTNLWGYCNENAFLKIPFRFTEASDFNNNRAQVRENAKVFIINTDGACIDKCPNSICDTLNCGIHGNCVEGRCQCRDGFSGDKCDIPPILDPFAAQMILIQGGTFMMGSPDSEADRNNDEYQHQVSVSSFKMSKYEVTQAQWEAIMGNNRSEFSGCAQCPVENVSWDDIQDFLQKLNAQTGKNYRLPTEAEWEYAARGGTSTPFYTGTCLSTDQANYDGNNPYQSCAKGEYRETTTPVGSFAPNKYGLYDMHGNVWEWCQDWYGEDYYNNSPSDNPKGPSTGTYRVLRGGSWYYDAQRCRSANRRDDTPDYRFNGNGFRLVFVPQF
jgi:formylglycine-generating enzyme required for sulfatase activity